MFQTAAEKWHHDCDYDGYHGCVCAHESVFYASADGNAFQRLEE